MSDYDSWLTTPPGDAFGSCPHCGCSQEDAERVWSSDKYRCPCGELYTDADAHPDPREMRDEQRMRDGGL